MLRGRNEAKIYIEFVLMFGGIFVENKLAKRTNLCSTIAKGNRLCDLITTNMEAFMRTILFVGCSKDWPEYLQSEEYRKWFCKTHTLPGIVTAIVDSENEETETNGDEDDAASDDNPASDDDQRELNETGKKKSTANGRGRNGKPVSLFVIVCVASISWRVPLTVVSLLSTEMFFIIHGTERQDG